MTQISLAFWMKWGITFNIQMCYGIYGVKGAISLDLGHVLIFGGTGMLLQATGWIVERAKQTVVYGRNEKRLEQIEKVYKEYGLQTRQWIIRIQGH